MTIRTTERRRGRQFAAALDSVPIADLQLLSLARLASSLGGTASIAGPGDEFRGALRLRLLAVGATTGVGVARPARVAAVPWRRRLVAAGAVLSIATGGVAATAVASTHAIPGDRLYEIKRMVEDVQLALATSDLAKGERYLAIASTRMSEVQALLRRDAGQVDDPVVVQELRDTLSDMSDAIASGSERFFSVFHRTANAAVLTPLEDFLNQRAGTLTDVRALLPAEVLPKQESLMGELRGIAAQVATVTGRTVPTLDPAAHAAALSVGPTVVEHASRGRMDRDALSKLATPAVNSVDDAVSEARRDAASAASAPQQPQRQAEVERNVRHLIEVDLLDPQGQTGIGTADGSDSAVPAVRPGSGRTVDGIGLLGLVPLGDTSIDTVVPGSLTEGLASARLDKKDARLRVD